MERKIENKFNICDVFNEFKLFSQKHISDYLQLIPIPIHPFYVIICCLNPDEVPTNSYLYIKTGQAIACNLPVILAFKLYLVEIWHSSYFHTVKLNKINFLELLQSHITNFCSCLAPLKQLGFYAIGHLHRKARPWKE